VADPPSCAARTGPGRRSDPIGAPVSGSGTPPPPASDEQAAGDVPFSRCDIWKQQEGYYRAQGIDAWAGRVPFYATSNQYIANSYAHVIARFMQEHARQGDAEEGTFYIVELGGGSGTFGFRLLKRLTELLSALRLDGLRFVYVWTDLVEANVEHARRHPAFAPRVARGELDFAVVDAQRATEIRLLESGVVLRPGATGGRPMIALCNYLFDTLPQDLFRVTERGMMEGRTRATGHAAGPEIAKPVFSYHDIEAPRYGGDEALHFDPVLFGYAREQPGELLFPIGALRCVRRLIELSGERLLLLVSDKGYSRHLDVFRHSEPSIAVHDRCFSMMVNFDAIGAYFRLRGGDAVHQSAQQSILTSVFVIGAPLDALPETGLAISDWLHQVSPGNLFALHTQLAKPGTPHSLESIVATLRLFHQDPHVWQMYAELIPRLLQSAPPYAIRDLSEGMEEIAANTYLTPGGFDTFASVGLFFQDLNEHAKALSYYHRSREHFGQRTTTLYNMGVCHVALGERDLALQMFESVMALDPEDIMARGWVSKLREEIEPRPSREP
jgi:tetratricopeptide (TPR) repeat protein